MSKLIEALTKDLNNSNGKETETVQTVDSYWDCFSSDDDASECGSLESIDLLDLDDGEYDDAVSFYCDYIDDEDVDLDFSPNVYKHSCIQRAMNGFTKMFKALSVDTAIDTFSPSDDRPLEVILTTTTTVGGIEDDIMFR